MQGRSVVDGRGRSSSERSLKRQAMTKTARSIASKKRRHCVCWKVISFVLTTALV
jgi:hypothetical protein